MTGIDYSAYCAGEARWQGYARILTAEESALLDAARRLAATRKVLNEALELETRTVQAREAAERLHYDTRDAYDAALAKLSN